MPQDQISNNISSARIPSSQEHLHPTGDISGLLMESVRDYAIFMTDVDGFITSWNAGAKNIKGYSASEILGKHISVFYTPEDVKLGIPLKNLEEAAKNGRFESEGWRVRKDGSLFWANIIFTPLRDAGGSLIGFAKVTRDITERKNAEEEVKRMNEELKRLNNEKLNYSLKEVSDYKYALDKACIVAITNQKGIITYVNENFCSISKYSEDELIGQDHRIINSGYHSKEFIHNLWVTVANGTTWKGEIKNRAKDGTFYWVDATIVPFLNEKGKPYQYVAIKADITERKKTEEELITLNEQLEEYVNSRTQQLELANNELESFSYSVSHDLRAPLRAIGGFSKILQEDYEKLLDAEGNRLLSNIMTNAKRMGRLIDDLLSFSRMSKKELTRNYINMYVLVNECLEELFFDKNSHNYRIDTGDLPPCNGDIAMLKQVWHNLLDNAIKYSSKNARPHIIIGSSDDGLSTIYYIKDNGVGFEMKYVHKLFGVFQRLHSNEEFEGTGVGLALVKRIINKHDGNVWAESEPGIGSTFYFSIPKNIPA